ncbi:HlyD family secretion protein [Sphingomonas sp. 3-13AW]|uniref:HlyD family secretion protein n=1 Tax=Sphingomonas sp. 3-13AW TaxID=3050450 RepID=UPI003BB62344
MTLFRPEAMRSQDRLHGEVSLVPPVSWQMLGLFLFASVALAAIFLSVATYSKSTTLRGEIQPDRGMARVVPTRAGVIEEMLVVEGQVVDQGQPLVRISVSTIENGGSIERRRQDAIGRRGIAIDEQEPAIISDSRSQISALQAQIAGGEAEIASIRDQIAQQVVMVKGAEGDLDKVRDIAARGFISGKEIREREDRASQRRQDLARLQQDEATRRSQVAVARAEMAKAKSELAIRLRSLQGQRAAVDQDAADADRAQSYVLAAGTAGRVTGITSHKGEPALVGRPLLSIIPEGGKMQVVLNVPTTASGFIEPGQEVRVSVDAFPYQTYGTVLARVASVSDAAVPVDSPEGDPQDAFVVRADLLSLDVRAYGETRPLRPGMMVTARIMTRRRSLFGLLFDPLYAVARR